MRNAQANPAPKAGLTVLLSLVFLATSGAFAAERAKAPVKPDYIPSTTRCSSSC
jgi:hypothetical protein